MRPRAHVVGMGVFLDDGAATVEGTNAHALRTRMTRDARKAEEGLPPKGSRTCAECPTVLSRYTPGPKCQYHSRMETLLRAVESKGRRT